MGTNGPTGHPNCAGYAPCESLNQYYAQQQGAGSKSPAPASNVQLPEARPDIRTICAMTNFPNTLQDCDQICKVAFNACQFGTNGPTGHPNCAGYAPCESLNQYYAQQQGAGSNAGSTQGGKGGKRRRALGGGATVTGKCRRRMCTPLNELCPTGKACLTDGKRPVPGTCSTD